MIPKGFSLYKKTFNYLSNSRFKTEKSNLLQDIGFMKNGIDALAPGQEESERVPLELVSHEEYSPVLITVTYKDGMGDDYDDEFTLDFNDRTERR